MKRILHCPIVSTFEKLSISFNFGHNLRRETFDKTAPTQAIKRSLDIRLSLRPLSIYFCTVDGNRRHENTRHSKGQLAKGQCRIPLRQSGAVRPALRSVPQKCHDEQIRCVVSAAEHLLKWRTLRRAELIMGAFPHLHKFTVGIAGDTVNASIYAPLLINFADRLFSILVCRNPRM